MPATLNLNELARIFAGRTLNSMVEGLAIGFFAWMLLRIVGRRNSSTRFAVWFSALLAIAVLPMLSGAASSAASAGSPPSAITLPDSWALGILAIWAVVAGIALARVGLGLWQLRKLRASCNAMDIAALDPVLCATMQRFQRVRPVQLCQSDGIQVPTAIGFLKPLVVIPAWAMQELSTAELNSILIHELAHLRRWDDWTNLAQQILKALLFFHPAVWWIENKLALEREMACDDAVLAETANPRGYARCLISMAEKSFLRRGLAMAQAIVNRVHQTSLRVAQILDANRSSATRVWKPALYSLAVFSAVSLILVSHAPKLVAFEDKAPNIIASVTAPGGVPISVLDSRLLRKQAAATRLGITAVRAAFPSDKGKAVLARRTYPGQDSARPIQAKFNQAKARRVIQVNNAGLIEKAEAPQTIFVVLQSEEYSQAGPMLWRLCVWHVVVFDSIHNPVETRIPAKQI